MEHATSCTKYFLLVTSAFILCFYWNACNPSKSKRAVSTGYYYWKTNWKLSESEINHLHKLRATDLYIRFFDINWDEQQGEALPIATINWGDTSFLKDINWIPTVFITNKTFQKLNANQLPEFSQKLISKLERLYPTSAAPDEVQIDCDWSESTKIKYFYFLDLLREKLKKKKISLSATIRLHQIKYFERTGVPPVNRGMLMVYNTGNLSDPNTKNSILEFSTAQKYFVNFINYPLELDIVLPAFSWGVLFRNRKMIKLLNEPTIEGIYDTSRFSPVKNNWIEVEKNTYLNGHFLYAGDKIRLEYSNLDEIKKVAKALSKALPEYPMKVCWYHLDSLTVKKNNAIDLQHVKDIFLED